MDRFSGGVERGKKETDGEEHSSRCACFPGRKGQNQPSHRPSSTNELFPLVDKTGPLLARGVLNS